ncbi:peptidase domain-containing ABC transporter [Chryseobacterium sp. Ch-15]|uniref:Peptidase domain-containing ABC transporter n=1 Tax=Chryseobacterium muglaense TaxID=2893752 RepID=A0A9Q3UVQ3_9FLAO|nr:peptidase domain-containing ABC transporter [Chryseobacterium muglaense]MBD3907311.1 peptidase domain-containing ABC transporter [Chryseobacterium muglaense]MCC9034351.1 peptidase domain-containing ABC transporter [Chryseobacterium muglaense]MCM2557007.1 peptidase domain-containing ABC transporter [Chryseobacterium muglaense]
MKFIHQLDQADCGPACICMIVSHYEKKIDLQFIKDQSFLTKDGTTLLGLSEVAEKLGFKTTIGTINIKDLQNDFLPCILHWNKNHFVILKKIYRNRFTGKVEYNIVDPSYGTITVSEDLLKKSWISKENNGIALFFEPTEEFYKQEFSVESEITLKSMFKFLIPYKNQFLILSLLLLIGTITTLIFPLLTQKLIDDGVGKKDFSIITYILLAQLGVFFGSIVSDIIRNWITLQIGTEITIKIISDFIKKLLSLPIRYFASKNIGDFNQRINDHERIEQFLTSQSLLTFFSLFTFVAFFAVLLYYNALILVIYISLTILSVSWSLFWIKKVKILDYFRFQEKAKNQESIYEIVTGVSEMKLNQFEDFKRSQWEDVQLRLFSINKRILKLNQIQSGGFEFINHLKNILITFTAAAFVIRGDMSLGILLSISYITGQMNAPVSYLVLFFRSFQDAKLSLERLKEVEGQELEEQEDFQLLPINSHFEKTGFVISNLSFQYEGPHAPKVLQNINVIIPEGKVTAIVGSSGSGKTTLLKILLKFYEPTIGEITFNGISYGKISPLDLRRNSGVVMQDGYIFSDTIERNIAMGDVNIDYDKLNLVINITNLGEFINQLPLGLSTKIGFSGNSISGGQTQRILIARAIYNDPHLLFLDEATSALDSVNEKLIHNNLQNFFKNKTVLIIAHRLSTVMNADNILVFKGGQIVEEGTHSDLIKKKEHYYELIKNQLELGT